MKKVFGIVLLYVSFLINAQEKKTDFGVIAGFNSLEISTEISGFDEFDTNSESGNGYFMGFFADFKLSDKISIQPEFLFSSSTNEGENLDQIIVPLMLKYFISENFTLQGGTMLDYLIEDDAEGINKFGIGLAFGAGYEVSEKIFFTIRYSFGISNRFDTDELGIGIDSGVDANAKFNIFQLGLGYRF